MLGTSENYVSSSNSNEAGPDNFAFYKCEVKRLLLENEDIFPFSIESTGNEFIEGEVKAKVKLEPSGGSFNNSLGFGLSDHKRERLNSLLRQSLTILPSEADGMLDPVVNMRQLQSQFKSKKMGIVSKPDCPNDPESCEEVEGDLQFLMRTDSSLVEETIKKYSDQLITTLNHMEKQLEELLDTVVATCRPMTLAEKRHLQKLIQRLPPKNLNRVVEIVQRSEPETQCGDEIFVNLERVDNTTLWRLYYYTQAVEKARKLAIAS